jgi:hypothetical protein
MNSTFAKECNVCWKDIQVKAKVKLMSLSLFRFAKYQIPCLMQIVFINGHIKSTIFKRYTKTFDDHYIIITLYYLILIEVSFNTPKIRKHQTIRS